MTSSKRTLHSANIKRYELFKVERTVPKKSHRGKLREGINKNGRPTVADLELRKKRIVCVATALFLKRGYAATSLVDIAQEAGVGGATLSRHFGDKVSLFFTIILEHADGIVPSAPMLEKADTVQTLLLRSARYACDFVLQPMAMKLMRLMVAESRRFPDLTKHIASKIFKSLRIEISVIFKTLADISLLPEHDYERSSDLFLDIVLGNTSVMAYANWITMAPSDDDLIDRVNLFILGRFGGKEY